MHRFHIENNLSFDLNNELPSSPPKDALGRRGEGEGKIRISDRKSRLQDALGSYCQGLYHLSLLNDMLTGFRQSLSFSPRFFLDWGRGWGEGSSVGVGF